MVSCRQVDTFSEGRKEKLYSWWIRFDFCRKLSFWLRMLVFPPSTFFFFSDSEGKVNNLWQSNAAMWSKDMIFFLNLKLLTLGLGFYCDTWEKCATAALWEDREHQQNYIATHHYWQKSSSTVSWLRAELLSPLRTLLLASTCISFEGQIAA